MSLFYPIPFDFSPTQRVKLLGEGSEIITLSRDMTLKIQSEESGYF